MKINQVTEEGFNINLSENEAKLIALIIGSMTVDKIKEIQGTLWVSDELVGIECDAETLSGIYFPLLGALRR